MSDLEEEFKELMQAVRQQILGRVQTGNLEGLEGDELIRMLEARMATPTPTSQPAYDSSSECWDESGCTIGREEVEETFCPTHGNVKKDSYGDFSCGWSQSMGYHCT